MDNGAPGVKKAPAPERAPRYRARMPPGDEAAQVGDLLAQLTDDEKLSMLSGDGWWVWEGLKMIRRYNARPIVAGAVARLGIEGVRFTDGPRGVVMGHATAFPVPMARGATFDPALEARVGDAIGVEARTLGANLFAGVCVNLLRHPAWGRAQETYGEDPHLLGEMGAALVEGTQRHVMACVKHFACNSMENARFKVDVRVDDADLRDVYLPHFKRCVDVGVAAVMSAYNKVNGDWCGHSRHLLADILKDQWGFDGFVMSDFFWGVRAAAPALNGGQDLEMPFHKVFRDLPRAVEAGEVERERVDDACRRLLRMQVRFRGRGEPDRYVEAAVAGEEHRALAREAAVKSFVLLRNEDGLLPLDSGSGPVAVIGRLAGLPNTGDHGSSWVRPPHVVTVVEGLREAASRNGASLVESCTDDTGPAVEAARSAATAVVVVGCSHRDEGEYIKRSGGDRTDLGLRPEHADLVEAVAATTRRTVVVLMGGSAFVTESWRQQVAAVLMVWYPGMEGGHAVADVVFGDAEPGGRLPCTWPRSPAQLPEFDRDAAVAEYGPLHGYRLMHAEDRDPAFWFGFGLGYTTFEYGAPRRDGATVSVEVRNTGRRCGDDVVQCYADLARGTDDREVPTLVGFERVRLDPGAAATVRFETDPRWRRVRVGPSADPRGLRHT